MQVNIIIGPLHPRSRWDTPLILQQSDSTDYPPYMREAQLLDVTLFMQKELETLFIRTFYFQHEMQAMAML